MIQEQLTVNPEATNGLTVHTPTMLWRRQVEQEIRPPSIAGLYVSEEDCL